MRVAGIMSGTSLDGIEVAIVDIEGRRIRAVAFSGAPHSGAARRAIAEVSNFKLGEKTGHAATEVQAQLMSDPREELKRSCV